MKSILHVSTIICLFSVSLCILPSCGKKEDDKAKASKPTVLQAEGVVVSAQQFRREYTTSGSLLPNEEVQLLPEISGRITAISFAEGSSVKKGQVLLRMNNDDIRAQVQKSEAQRDLQEKIKERQAELLRIGGISKQDFETTTTQIESISADLAYTKAQLRKTSILAPFDGRIGIRNVSVGAVVSPTTIIATLQQIHILKMDFSLPEQYRDELKAGKEVQFTVTGSLDTFSGTISALAPSADATTRTLKARAIVNNKDGRLTAGAFTHVIIPFENNKAALLIPSQSVIPTSREKMAAVIKNGKATMVPIKLGARTSAEVEVLEGLSPGDTILTTGMMQVKPGMQVNVKVVSKPS